MNIHIIWIGSRIPPLIASNILSWKEVYGDRVKVWTDSNIGEFKSEIINNKNFHPATRADLLRIMIVQKYGGWYVDADSTPGPRKMKEFCKPILSFENERRPLNGLFFSPVAHPFLELWSSETIRSIKTLSHADNSVADISGPGALSRALQEYLFRGGVQKSDLIILRNAIQIDGNVATLKQRKSSLAIHQSLKSWNLLETKSSQEKGFIGSMYMKWLYWGKLGLIRESLRVMIHEPILYLQKIPRLDFHFHLANCHTLRTKEYANLETKFVTSDLEFLLNTQNQKVSLMRTEKNLYPKNFGLFWYRIPLLKSAFYWRKNFLKSIETLNDY